MVLGRRPCHLDGITSIVLGWWKGTLATTRVREWRYRWMSWTKKFTPIYHRRPKRVRSVRPTRSSHRRQHVFRYHDPSRRARSARCAKSVFHTALLDIAACPLRERAGIKTKAWRRSHNPQQTQGPQRSQRGSFQRYRQLTEGGRRRYQRGCYSAHRFGQGVRRCVPTVLSECLILLDTTI